MNLTISEPFQLLFGSARSQKICNYDAISCSYNRDFPGYATVTAQKDGIQVWDLQNLHAVASYSVGEHVAFAAPTFSLHVTENGNRSVISYAVIAHCPGTPTTQHGRVVWVIRQPISGPSVAASEKTAVVADRPLAQICGTGHPTVPLLLVSTNASLFLANERVDIKSKLDWPGEYQHLKTFVFPRGSCSFIQGDTDSCSSAAITCCQTGMILHIRLAFLGEEIVPVGTCEIPIASSTKDTCIIILGLTCSPSGILSFVDARGIWATYQLASTGSSLVSTPISEKLHLQRFATLNNKSRSSMEGFSIVSLGTSLVLLAALVEETQDLSLQLWDLLYGVLLTAQSMPIPSAFASVRIRLTVADNGQVLLTASPAHISEKRVDPKRSSIHVVPMDPCLTSNLAAALGKAALTTKWLSLDNSSCQNPEDDETTKIISDVQRFLRKNNVQKAEQAFLKWVDSHSSREAALGHEFVKKIFNVILPPELSLNYPYTPRITRCLLDNAVVSTIVLNGHLITALRQQGDWENLMLALTKVTDISESELVAVAKFLIDRQRRNDNAMEMDTSEDYVPPLWSYLSACVSYPFSAIQMRLAIRKHLADAEDLVLILEILENWIQGGTEHGAETLLKSAATNMEMSSSGAESPPYPKIITFLQALLDASFVALLQYQASYDVLRRILSHIEPEIIVMESLEPLRGMLGPFVKAHSLKEKTAAFKESPAEWRQRRKQLEQQEDLNVGLYRLEELVL